MRPLVTADEMRELDRQTISGIGLPGAVLMETAGRAVVEAMLERFGSRVRLGPTVILCGGGNNGGDGFVVGRVLGDLGFRVQLYLAVERSRLLGDAALHAAAFEAGGGHVLGVPSDPAQLEQMLAGAQVVVDALFGTGLDRELEAPMRELVAATRRISAPVVAVDVPSGLSADSGAVLGTSVRATLTVTMGVAKVGLVCEPGFAEVGELVVAEIGIPERLARAVATVWELEDRDVGPTLAEPGPLVHKGTRGHVLALAGSPGHWGAGRLTALAALRAGAGLVTLVAEEADVAAPSPVMTAAVNGVPMLERLAVGKAAVLCGPGMTTMAKGRELVACLLRQSVPVIVDADALNHLGTNLDEVAQSRATAILTPHPGEAGRLLGTSAAEVQRDRIMAVRELAMRSKAIVVLKGARPLICDGRTASPPVLVVSSGTPDLATAGSGDVLTGMIAGLASSTLEPLAATAAAVVWHGHAGRRARVQLGGPGVVASDLVDALPAARSALLAGCVPA